MSRYSWVIPEGWHVSGLVKEEDFNSLAYSMDDAEAEMRKLQQIGKEAAIDVL